MTPHIQPSGILPGGVIPVRDFPPEREPWIELGWPGIEPKRPCLVIVNFDDSGSVTAPQGNRQSQRLNRRSTVETGGLKACQQSRVDAQ